MISMPCSKYKGKQRNLCYATKEWKDWRGIRKKKIRVRAHRRKGTKGVKEHERKGYLVSGSRVKDGYYFDNFKDAEAEMRRQMRKGASQSGISEVSYSPWMRTKR